MALQGRQQMEGIAAAHDHGIGGGQQCRAILSAVDSMAPYAHPVQPTGDQARVGVPLERDSGERDEAGVHNPGAEEIPQERLISIEISSAGHA